MEPYELEPHHRNVSNEAFLADLKRVAAEIGRDTVTIDQYNERGQYHASSLIRRFKSWFQTLEQAGLRPSRSPLNIPDEDLFRNLVNVWAKLGRQPKYDDLTSQMSQYSAGTYEKRFGGWRRALEAFVRWANEGEVPAPKNTSVLARSGHKTTRYVNYRLKFLVMRRDNFRCRITGRSPATDRNIILEVDHIVPWNKGGETIIENLQTLAKDINIGKSNLDMHSAS